MPDATSIPFVTVQYERSGGQVVEERFTETFTLGRDARCNVRLDAPMVSSMHARVFRQGDEWHIQDLYSRYGLFVDGRPVQKGVLIGHTSVQLGKEGPVVVLRMETPVAAPSSPEAVPRVVPPRTPTASSTSPPIRPPAPVPSFKPAPSLADERYEASRFSLPLPDGWSDKTVYTLIGPLTDGVQHNITVSLDPETPFETAKEFATEQLQALEGSLPGIQMLKKEETHLAKGTPAYRAIFKWAPAEDQTLFQQQVYIVDQNTAYTLTASFSRKTRKTVGPTVTRIMLAFEPKP